MRHLIAIIPVPADIDIDPFDVAASLERLPWVHNSYGVTVYQSMDDVQADLAEGNLKIKGPNDSK